MMDSAKMRSEKVETHPTSISLQNGGIPDNANIATNGGIINNSDLRDTLQQNYHNQSSKFSTQSQLPPSATSN